MQLTYIADIRMPTEKAHGIQIMEMCRSFARCNLDVELVVAKRKNAIDADPFAYYGMEKNFQITHVPVIDLVQYGRLGFWIEQISFAISAALYIRWKKKDIIFSRSLLPLIFLRYKKVLRIWEAHSGIWNFVVWIGTASVSTIVCISGGVKQFYQSHRVDPEKLVIFPDGVRLSLFHAQQPSSLIRQQLGISPESKLVVYTGHLYKWKGVHVLAQAAFLLDEYAHIVIIGGLDTDVQKFRKQYQYTNLHIIGSKPYQDIPQYLQAADVLVLPNSGQHDISRLYTSPMKMFEYMASGVPIVASDLPSIREILHEGNAFFVDADNPTALADKIKFMLQNRGASEEKALQALGDVQKYSWDNRARNIIKLLLGDLHI